MSFNHEVRLGEWRCECRDANVRSKSCLKCLRCGADKPDPVTLGRACYALGVFMKALDRGRTQEQAMQEALEADQNNQGKR